MGIKNETLATLPVWTLWGFQVTIFGFITALAICYAVAAVVYCVEFGNADKPAGLPQIEVVVPAQAFLGITIEAEKTFPIDDPAAFAEWSATWRSKWAMPFATFALIAFTVFCLGTAFNWSEDRGIMLMFLLGFFAGGTISYLVAIEPAVNSLNQLQGGLSFIFWALSLVALWLCYAGITDLEVFFKELELALQKAKDKAKPQSASKQPETS